MESSDEEIFQAKQFEFLGSFPASSQHTQVVEFSADGGLAEVLGVPQKCEVTLAEKCRNNARNQEKQKPRREHENRNRHGGGGNHLLHQPSDGLDHTQAVGGLHPRPLQPVVENRIFISNKIQFRRVLHHPNADVAGIFVRQQSIATVNFSGGEAAREWGGG